MSLSELLNRVSDDFNEIAKLHKPELQDTSGFPFWNSSYFQLIKLEMMVDSHKDSSTIIAAAESLLKGGLAEMTAAIPQMVSAEHERVAIEWCTKLKNDMSLFIDEVQKQMSEPSVTRTMAK